MDGWRYARVRAANRRETTRRVVARWRGRLVARAYDLWLDRTLATRLSRELALRAAHRAFFRTLARAFETWVERAERAKIRRVATERCVARWRSKREASAFAAWRCFVDESRRLRIVARRVGAKIAAGETARAFASWRRSVHRARTFEALARRVLYREARAAMMTWIDAVEEARRDCAGARRADGFVARIARRRRAAALTTWIDATRRARMLGRGVRNVLERVLRGCVKDAFATWVAETEARRAEKENLRRCLTRKRVAQRWFLRWYWDAFDSDIQVALANILGTAENAMEDAYSPASRPGMHVGSGFPSAVRAMRPLQPDGASSDSDLTSSDDEDMQLAADAIFAQGGGAPLDAKNAEDVRAARRMLTMSTAKSARRADVDAAAVAIKDALVGDKSPETSDSESNASPEQPEEKAESFESRVERVA